MITEFKVDGMIIFFVCATVFACVVVIGVSATCIAYEKNKVCKVCKKEIKA